MFIFYYRCMTVTFHGTLLKPTDDYALKILQRCIHKFLFSNIPYVMDCKQMWLSNPESGLQLINSLNKEHVTYYAGVVSTHNTAPSQLSNSSKQKNIFLLPVLSPNAIKISSRFFFKYHYRNSSTFLYCQTHSTLLIMQFIPVKSIPMEQCSWVPPFM
jgi:hypothetical protein